MRGEGREQLRNAGISIILSLVVVLLFYFASSQIGSYDTVDILGGAVYSFILSMIISFSIIPKLVSSLSEKRKAASDPMGDNATQRKEE